MGVFNITSEESTAQIYCFQGYWDENDTIHNCPELCGQINYIDVYNENTNYILFNKSFIFNRSS